MQIGDASRAKFEANKGVRHGTPGLFVLQYINLCIERILCALMYPVCLRVLKALHVCFMCFGQTLSCAADENHVIYTLYIYSTGDLHIEVQEPTYGETASED